MEEISLRLGPDHDNRVIVSSSGVNFVEAN